MFFILDECVNQPIWPRYMLTGKKVMVVSLLLLPWPRYMANRRKSDGCIFAPFTKSVGLHIPLIYSFLNSCSASLSDNIHR